LFWRALPRCSTPSFQEPAFKAFQASSSVLFVARKEARLLASAARIALIAFNVAGAHGLHDTWRFNVGSLNGNPVGVNGLGSTSTVQCGAPLPCAFNTSCTTI
jgi:hypothetical protein